MFMIGFLFLVIAASLANYIADKNSRDFKSISKYSLFYTLVIGVGLQGVIVFIFQMLFGDQFATRLGWPPNNPFQYETATAYLAFGALGITCVFIRKWEFWLATGIGSCIFLMGDFFVRAHDVILKHNFASYYLVQVLQVDIIIPILLAALLILNYSLKNTEL
jgi:hypothetical protein